MTENYKPAKCDDSAAGDKPSAACAGKLQADSHTEPGTVHSHPGSDAHKGHKSGQLEVPRLAAFHAESTAGDGLSVVLAGGDDKAAIKDLVRKKKTAEAEKPSESGGSPQNSKPVVKVVFSDTSTGGNTSNADYRIEQGHDGKVRITASSAAKVSTGNQITVEVARVEGQVERPSKQEQQAIDTLSTVLCTNDKGDKTGTIENPQGLVSDSVVDALNAGQAQASITAAQAVEHLPPAARDTVHAMQRFEGAGSGHMSAQEARNFFPGRSVPQMSGEDDRLFALKNVVAAFATSRNDAHPYEAVRKFNNGMVGAGRYMLTFSLIEDWLADLLGNPPDPKKLAELEKKNPELAKLLKSSEFKALLAKLEKGETPTAEELKKALPKELQENIASAEISKFSARFTANGHVDAGRVVASMRAGHAVTDAEMETPENQAIAKSAGQLHQIAEAHTRNLSGDIYWNTTTNGNLAAAAEQSVNSADWLHFARATGVSPAALEYGNLGCAAAVSDICHKAGISYINATSVDQAEQQALAHGARYAQLNQVRAGDNALIILHGNGKAHEHIGVLDQEHGLVIANSSGAKETRARSLHEEMAAGHFTSVRVLVLPKTA